MLRLQTNQNPFAEKTTFAYDRSVLKSYGRFVKQAVYVIENHNGILIVK